MSSINLAELFNQRIFRIAKKINSQTAFKLCFIKKFYPEFQKLLFEESA